MENKELKFKTNLNCAGCVSKVTADLDAAKGITNWSVNTESRDKILTVTSAGITKEQVIDIVEKKGFEASPITL